MYEWSELFQDFGLVRPRHMSSQLSAAIEGLVAYFAVKLLVLWESIVLLAFVLEVLGEFLIDLLGLVDELSAELAVDVLNDLLSLDDVFEDFHFKFLNVHS